MAISKNQGDIRDGAMVHRVQEALKQRGFDPGPVDGRFGDGTENAVRQFQTSKGLMADGIVGQQTWAALGFKGQVPHPVRID